MFLENEVVVVEDGWMEMRFDYGKLVSHVLLVDMVFVWMALLNLKMMEAT